MEITPIPVIPEQLKISARQGRLVPFIGAGVSQIAGAPGWHGFADQVLAQLAEAGILNHAYIDQIRSRGLPPRIKLALAKQEAKRAKFQINHDSILHPAGWTDNVLGQRIYQALSKLAKHFVTTNFDRWLGIDSPIPMSVTNIETISSASIPNNRKSIYNPSEFYISSLNDPTWGAAIHLHGSVTDPENMVLTTEDYIRQYGYVDSVDLNSNATQTFLRELFQQKDVLFVGYGLDELEILEYVILKAQSEKALFGKNSNHFILLPFFKHEWELAIGMQDYFKNECGVTLIPYSRDEKNYDQLVDVLEYFAASIPIGSLLNSERKISMEAMLGGGEPRGQIDFVTSMCHNNESQEYGFELLSNSDKRNQFFNLLLEKDLLSPKNNPAPKEAKEHGYILVPVWPALKYLTSVASEIQAESDLTFGEKLIDVVIAVSRGANDGRGIMKNHHTYRAFAEILAILPEPLVTDELITEATQWLECEYDQGLVGSVFCEKLIPRFLTEKNFQPKHHALPLLKAILVVRWDTEEQPSFAVEPFWLKEFFGKNINAIVHLIGIGAFKQFRLVMHEVFSKSDYPRIIRPIIEDNSQFNYHEIENIAVECLRDTLIIGSSFSDRTWVEAGLKEMYCAGSGTERRISIYIFDRFFTLYRDLIAECLNSKFFEDECQYESFSFLKHHFSSLEEKLKDRVFDYIKNIKDQSNTNSDQILFNQRKIRYWLSTICGQGYQAADDLFLILEKIPNIGPLDNSSDFFGKMSVSSAIGSSPYSVEEIKFFLQEGTLVKRLNAYQPTTDFDFRIRALCDVLEEAIKQQPVEFFREPDSLLALSEAYKYSYLNALKALWNLNNNQLDWSIAWPQLLNWIGKILSDDFWIAGSDEVVVNLTPNKNWILQVVSELIKDGVRDHSRTFNLSLFSIASDILKNVLAKLPHSSVAPKSDPMDHAVNSMRGKVLENLIIFAFTFFKLNEKEKGDSANAWSVFADTFDSELEATKTGNFEFSTFLGKYYHHFSYINREWVKENSQIILMPLHDTNFLCTLNGLAYAQATQQLYTHLKESGAIKRALATKEMLKLTRDKVIERIMLAYLWDQEQLESDITESLFCISKKRDLLIAVNFLWLLNNQKLDLDQINRILAFGKKAAYYALAHHEESADILEKLSCLLCYVDVLEDECAEISIALAPWVHTSYYFSKELARLAPNSPKKVAEVALAYLKQKTYPEYDYQSNWLSMTKSIVSRIEGLSDLRLLAIEICDLMGDQPGFSDLYKTL